MFSSDILLLLAQPALTFLIAALMRWMPGVGAERSGASAFALAYALYGTGLLAQMLLIPANIHANIMLAGLLYSGAVILFCEGLSQIGHVRRAWGVSAVIMAIALAVRTWYTFGDFDGYMRVWTLYSATTLCLAIVLWKIRHLSRGVWQERLLFWLLVIFVFSFVPRILLTLSPHEPRIYGYDGTAFWLSTQFSMHVFVILLAFVLLLVSSNRTIQHLRRASTVDALTGLLNRRGFETNAPAQLAQATRYCLIALDLDHFKQINDKYGHAMGDQVLRQVGQLLRVQMRPTDMAARMGGEEFLILLPGLPLSHTVGVAERLRKLIAEHAFNHGNPPVRCTGSFGVAEFPSHIPWTHAYPRVDALLYKTKAEGRNRVGVQKAGTA